MSKAIGLATPYLDYTSAIESANQSLIRSVRFTQVESTFGAFV